MKISIWDKLNRFPPIVCRLLARRKLASGGVVALSSEEIAQRSGMTVMEVNSLSWQSSWDDVSISKLRVFSKACGVDFTNSIVLREQAAYMRNNPSFKYLRKNEQWDSLYKPMILSYLNHVNRN